MAPCKKHTYVHALISDQAPSVSMRAVAGVNSPHDVAKKPWADLWNTRQKKRDAVELSTTVHLVTNIKQGGLVHRLAKSSQHVPREQRRSHCGWRVGNAVAHVRFTKTTFWPPCQQSLLCSRCFCNGAVATTNPETVTAADEIDRIEN